MLWQNLGLWILEIPEIGLGVLDKLISHLLLLLRACYLVLVPKDCPLVTLLLLLANVLNLLICLSLTLINLSSLTLFMNPVHLSIVVVVTIDNSLDLQLSTLTQVSCRMPLIYLILS